MPGVDKEKEYEKLHKLFGIEDILEEDNTARHVCTVSIYIPSDLELNNKSIAYYTGIVKHIELFKDRIENPESSLLYIYYDAMFDADIDSIFFTYTDEASAPDETSSPDKESVPGPVKEIAMAAAGLEGNVGTIINNAVFTAARKRMAEEPSSAQIVILIMLYRLLLDKIIEDRARYSHIRLFSYDCSRFKNKRHYFGHPEVFGSIVRFLPLYDTRLEQVTTLNGSHAMTPRLARILTIFGELPYKHVLSGFYGYNHRDYKYILDLLKLGSYKEMYDNPESEEIRSVLFGGLSSIKPKELQMYSLYNILIPMITLYNKTGDPGVFKYGIDETLLTYIIILKDKSMTMSLLHEKVSRAKSGIDPGMFAIGVINYLSTYDEKKTRLYPDIDTDRLSRFVSSEMTNTRRYNPLVLYTEDRLNTKIRPLFGEILSREVIATLIDNASGRHQKYEEFHAELDRQLADPDYRPDSIDSTLETLLYGLDEPKPLYIALFESPLNSYPQMFTLIDPTKYMVGDYSYDSIAEEVSNAVFSYYRDPEKVLRKPYEVTDRLSARLFSVDIKDNRSPPMSLNIRYVKGHKIYKYGITPNSVNNIYKTAPSLENLNSVLSAQNTGSRRQKPITKKVRMGQRPAITANNKNTKNNSLKKTPASS